MSGLYSNKTIFASDKGPFLLAQAFVPDLGWRCPQLRYEQGSQADHRDLASPCQK